MLECYLQVGGGWSPGGMVCATALLWEEDVSAFSRRWRRLLLKHELSYVRLEELKKVATHKGWDAHKQRAVLEEFAQVTQANLEDDMMALVVAVDSKAWSSLERRQKRTFRSEHDFCFQRLVRLVLDRIEATGLWDSVSIVLDLDVSRFGRYSDTIQSVFKADSRAENLVTSIKFADATKNALSLIHI